MLKCEGLGAAYGDIVALRGVDMHVQAGEAVALIGVNGAGKTTLLRAVSGLLPTTGTLSFDGRAIDNMPVQKRVRGGIAHVPEGRRIFPGLTVRENLEVGASIRGGGAQRAEDFDRVYDLFPRLKERAGQLGWSLSGGEQQMLAIGRALMSRPRLLLLDEPLSALDLNYQFHVMDLLNQETRDNGLITVIVLHDLNIALRHADYTLMIRKGELIAEGSPREVISPASLADVYGVLGRVEPCSRGIPQVLIDGLHNPIH